MLEHRETITCTMFYEQSGQRTQELVRTDAQDESYLSQNLLSEREDCYNKPIIS